MNWLFCVLLLLAGGCETGPKGRTREIPTTLHGYVLHKEPSRTLESWNAGGKDYYVLDVGNLPLPPGLRTAEEGVTLIPTWRVSTKDFAAHLEKLVIVTGYFVDAIPNKSVSSNGDELGSPIYRITNGLLQEVGFQAAPSGGGFRVSAISDVQP